MDLITSLISEASHYLSFDQIESLVEGKDDLSNLPVQPLYALTINMSDDAISEYLPKFSCEQRQAFLDIDLWHKDELDVDSFSRWPKIYDMCKDDEVVYEFVKSDEFLLFLKGRFDIYTFDSEDPIYPDHDYYFLTDDNLLLFEYDENNEIASQVQSLIRKLYAREGVEKAYAFLFKLVADTFSSLQEEEYRFKKGRLQDFGFVDYYDALALYSAFPSLEVMDNFISKGNKITGTIDRLGVMQTLPQSSLVAYKDLEDEFVLELEKIKDEKRREFLQFNFLKLVNSSLTFHDSLKAGQVSMVKIGKETKSLLELGYSYIKYKRRLPKGVSLFEFFSFTEIFKIGNTLTKDLQKKIKKALASNGFNESNEEFLGDFFNTHLNNVLNGPITLMRNKKSQYLNHYADYLYLLDISKTLIDIVVFISEFYKTFKNLKDDHRLLDSFYLNYKVEDIDFEALLISSFAGHMLAIKNDSQKPKLGLTLEEFKRWATSITNQDGKIKTQDPHLKKCIMNFAKEYGMDRVFRFHSYLEELLSIHMSDYDYQNLNDEDYQFVGGAIILKHQL